MWLAQTTSSDPTEWIQLGVPGLVVLGILTGWLWAKPAVDRILEENRRLRDEQSRQIEALIAEVHTLRSAMERERRERGP